MLIFSIIFVLSALGNELLPSILQRKVDFCFFVPCFNAFYSRTSMA